MLLLAACALRAAAAPPAVSDDSRRQVRLPTPAQRIISLSPHITELLFAAGAGDRVAGTVRYSDYPAAARGISRIGDTYDLDMERVISLRPDLVIIWRSGTRQTVIDEIEATGLPVYFSEPRTLPDIAATLRNLGKLAGTSATAETAADRFMQRLTTLRERYAGRRPVRVFYQFWQRPIFTVNGEHIINRVIELCGGRNIFAGLPVLTPRVDREAVLARNPEVIIASGETAARPAWLDDWQSWPELAAVRNGHIHFIPPDLLLRHTPRILDGAELMCEYIDKARTTAVSSEQ